MTGDRNGSSHTIDLFATHECIDTVKVIAG